MGKEQTTPFQSTKNKSQDCKAVILEVLGSFWNPMVYSNMTLHSRHRTTQPPFNWIWHSASEESKASFSLTKYLLSTRYLPGIISVTRETSMNKVLASLTQSKWERQKQNKTMHIWRYYKFHEEKYSIGNGHVWFCWLPNWRRSRKASFSKVLKEMREEIDMGIERKISRGCSRLWTPVVGTELARLAVASCK